MKSTVSFIIEQPRYLNSTSQLNEIQTISSMKHKEGGQCQKTSGESNVVAEFFRVGTRRVGSITTFLTKPVNYPQPEEGQVSNQFTVEGTSVIVTCGKDVFLTGDTRKIFVSNRPSTSPESNSARVLVGCKPIRCV